ncbi:hypothetical protein Pcac1_g18988 [Phytophthora cactorum]|nr:hypothetical protein Pcac1_g18988 [Phytophthora cactorum]
MGSLAKSQAQESASADTATSVPASADKTTSTIESRLSDGGYHVLQYRKLVEDKAAAPETILEDSSVLNTDGSMPTDDASDISDVLMKFRPKLLSAAVTHDLVPELWGHHEGDPSASSSKRSHNEEEEKAPTPVSPSSPRSVTTNALRRSKAYLRSLPGSTASSTGLWCAFQQDYLRLAETRGLPYAIVRGTTRRRRCKAKNARTFFLKSQTF